MQFNFFSKSKLFFSTITTLFFSTIVVAQNPVLATSPGFLKEVNANPVTITIDGSRGNAGLLGYTPVTDIYIHTGVITNLSTGPTDWKHVLTTWPGTVAAFNAPSLGNNKWNITLPANLRTYYGITNANEKIVKIAILFRNGAGTSVLRNSDASDMYIPVDTTGNLLVKFTAPPTEPRYVPWAEPVNVSIGQTLPVSAVTSLNATINLELNGTNIGSVTNVSTISLNPTIIQGCNNTLKVIATDGNVTVSDSLQFYVNAVAGNLLPLPNGVRDGINYNAGDTSVTLVLFAPGKTSIAAVGTFNNWVPSCNYIMNRTPDSNRHWITINGLAPGTLYKFQYLVDGLINTTDPYCDLILDPNNDAYILPSTYPNMPTYPAGRSGIVGTFTPGQIPYTWTTTNYTRPSKKNMVIYEMLMRDFLSTHDWKTAMDTLGYLKNLGINCIEIMPFTEFEGNESWGYNPDFFFAPDKYLGTKTDLKKFIDKAHSMGMAVVLDAVMNQVTGVSPLAKMWWNSSTNKPTANNPYLNVDATHPYNVFNDFNHESKATKYHVRRFMDYWLNEYKLDGFRWDLAKGFTQTNSGSNVGQWSNYDQSRVNIWKDYYDSMQVYNPNSYCILEFLGSDNEESTYANYGMLLWGKTTDEFATCLKGYNGNLDRAYFKNRPGYNEPGLVTYGESHDEERMMYATLQNGNSTNGGHNAKDFVTATKRAQAIYPILLGMPGPKMLWQFQELGYDYSINYCLNGTNSTNCRLDPKPIKWNYFADANRKKIYDVVSAMNKLRNLKPNAFAGATITTGTDLGSSMYKKIVISHSDLQMVSIANYDVNTQSSTVTFPSTGWWYNYLGTDSINIAGATQSISLPAGGFKVYTKEKLTSGVVAGPNAIATFDNISEAGIYPNPGTENSVVVFNLMSTEAINITITDITGKIISTLYNGNMNAGEHQLELGNAINSLSKGIYYCQLQTKNGNKVLKFGIQ
jgi:1,4-alpha-glucan branching enzyme